MAYCDQTDVERAAGGRQRLIELSDLAGTGALDSTVVDQAITDASGWADVFIPKRYAIPIAASPGATPPGIRALVAAEAVYLLKGRRPHNLTDDDRDAHKERFDILDRIAKGTLTPGQDPLPARSSQVAPVTGTRDGETYPMSRDGTKGYW